MQKPVFSRVAPTPRVLVVLFVLLLGLAAFAQTPRVGATAPDFTLSTPAGAPVRLSALEHGQDLVLVVLRGYPGYQCPYCQKQVHDFVAHASDFARKQATVLLVYPGPPGALDQHAQEFLAAQSALPANVVLVTDPDYTVTKLYGLRWDAPQETAYPSTFLLDGQGTIRFEKVSKGHGDRLSAQEALEHLPAH